VEIRLEGVAFGLAVLAGEVRGVTARVTSSESGRGG
jgi:hypothetical protein